MTKDEINNKELAVIWRVFWGLYLLRHCQLDESNMIQFGFNLRQLDGVYGGCVDGIHRDNPNQEGRYRKGGQEH